MEPRYSHADHEQAIYHIWQNSDCFNPNSVGSSSPQPSQPKKTGRPPFCIIMPPPNANDPLHIGHAMFVTVEDILARFHRMSGDDTLWLPGTDHAGIETQYVFEKKLQKDGKSRFNFDRQTLYQMIWDYVQENSGVAMAQMKKLGASADWSRYVFTLDPTAVTLALDTFNKLYKDGLIYRAKKLVNYCTKCGTSYSELEVVHTDQTTTLYYIKYPLADGQNKPSGEFVTVATTRPEPIFADTHLAVHPTNPKTKHLIGQKALNPLTDQPMEIIADDFVDPEFGTGVVKLTPAHDFNDFEVAQKHHLPLVEAINAQGKITKNGGEWAGLSVLEARKKIVEFLDQKGLIDHDKTNKHYSHSVGTCYRCGRVIEPLPMAQFFIKVNDPQKNMAKNALQAIESGQTKIHGKGHDKILTHWLKNLKDWNISRQIVWGITIPVWYPIKGNEDKIVVSFIDTAGKYQSGILAQMLANYDISQIKTGLQQVQAEEGVDFTVSVTDPDPSGTQYLPETDAFDTWFSSAQWPVTTLKTNKKDDFERFYPTSVMETGYDILPIWVMRMLLMCIYLDEHNRAPFKDVYLHGLIRDEKGQKMSKSKGNVINPLEVIDEFGADALRMALVIRSSPGLDKGVGRADFKAARNLTNKIWNAARFVMTARDSQTTKPPQSVADSNGAGAGADAWFYDKLNDTIAKVTQMLTDLKPGLAADTIYNEFWHWYCDECIEKYKVGDLGSAALLQGLTVFLKLLHPFVPFVTEAVWQELRAQQLVQDELLITAPWPRQPR